MTSTSIRIAVACRNASGLSDLPVFTVSVTGEQYELGIHYEMAEILAEEHGYEAPFVCFDEAEQGAIVSAARRLSPAPRAAG
ncbi:MAG: hypothetical protein LBS49_02800 [Candidatus Accumulibacter sp.]|jgi:hypothetical protein|nr:hypothetical protein [Accumulibacter sp.]